MAAAKYPDALNALTDAFKSFPGIGKRSAERMAFSVLKWKTDKREALGKLLSTLDSKIGFCPECGNIADAGKKCCYCLDESRNTQILCIVEESAQIASIEASSLFKGLYHVLGGRLAPLEGKTADDLNLDSLTDRVRNNGITEIILALSQDVEGQATAVYISELLKDFDVTVTGLARGLPAGSDLAYADAATVAAALSGRRTLQ